MQLLLYFPISRWKNALKKNKSMTIKINFDFWSSLREEQEKIEKVLPLQFEKIIENV